MLFLKDATTSKETGESGLEASDNSISDEVVKLFENSKIIILLIYVV